MELTNDSKEDEDRGTKDSEEKTTISLQYISYLLMTAHLFESSDIRKRLPFRLYSFCLQGGIPLDTPLRDLERSLPRSLHREVGRTFLTDPRIQTMGLYGQPIPVKTFSDLSRFSTILEKRDFSRTEPNGQGLYHSFREMQQTLGARILPVRNLAIEKMKPGAVLELAWSKIRENEAIRVVRSPADAGDLAKLVVHLLEVAAAGMPLASVSPTMIKTFMNASVFADVVTSKDLLLEVFQCFEERFQSYLAFSIFYQAALANIVGPDFLIGLNKMGYLLGFQGSGSRPFISEFASKDGFGPPLFREYRIVEVCSEQKMHTEKQYLATSKSKGFKFFSHRAYSNPFRIVQTEPGDISVGRTSGYFLVDASLVPEGETILPKKQKDATIPLGRSSFSHHDKDHGFDIIYLEPNVFEQQDFSGLSFFHSIPEKRELFGSLVQENSATKPNLPRKMYEDRRWNEKYEKVLGIDPRNGGSCEAISNDLNELEAVQRTNRMFSEDWEMFDVPSSYTPGIVKLAGLLLAGEIEVEDCGFGPIEVDIKRGERRDRVICRVSRRQKTVDRVLNHPLKITQSRINLERLDGGLTNFLPGTSPTIQTPPRFLHLFQGEGDVVVANTDVRQCFDSIRWRHESFLPRMAASRTFLEKNGFAEGAEIHWKVLIDYFIGALSCGKFEFYTKTETFPPRGSLPTGFVLSPTLWHFLALPLCFHLQEMKRQGKILAWDLCGDDLMIVAPAGISKTVKHEVLSPWLEFAEDLDLGFHFFKNYKDNMVPLHPSAKSLTLEDVIVHDPNADFVDQAWSKPWPKAAPFYHAGVALFGDQICVTPRLYYDPEATIEKIRRGREMRLCLAQSSLRRFGNQSQFLPSLLLRGFQLPELSTGALANLVLGATKFEDKHISGSEQLALMLWGPRTPIGRRQFDRKKTFHDPAYVSVMPSDYEINVRLQRMGGKSVATRIETLATGRYFIDGQPITKELLSRIEKVQQKEEPIPIQIDELKTGKTTISDDGIDDPATAEELLGATSKQLLRYDQKRRPIFFRIMEGSVTYLQKDIVDDTGSIISIIHYFNQEELLRLIKVDRDRRKKEREEKIAKENKEKLERRVLKLSERYPKYVKDWEIEKAERTLREWFMLSQETPNSAALKRKIQECKSLIIKLPELEELAFLIIQGAGGSQFSEELANKESIIHRNEGRWIYKAKKLMSSPKSVEKGSGQPLAFALSRLPCLAFTLRHDRWSDVARAAFVHLTQAGGVVVPYFKGMRSKGVEIWKPGFFQQEWPQRVLRSLTSPYFPAEGDEDEALNPINVKFVTTDQATTLLALCRKQKKLLDRYEKTIEHHRKIHGRRDPVNRTAEAFSISRQEIDGLVGLLRGSGAVQ